MIRAAIGVLISGLLLPVWAEAQDRERKRATATRVDNGAIRVDGRLDESAWQLAAPLTDFVQKEPSEGDPASDRMDVRFVFDGTALYVGARMYSAGPIQAPLGRRDEGDQAEYLDVSLDTYLDRRTASTFGVTATGVRLDHFYASDDEFNDDATFNPVWSARTSVLSDGWIAELWIPFSQLRFVDRAPRIWGLNVRRWIPSRNEEVFWSPVLRTDERWASLFGDLHGLDGIRPRRRLEVLPYVAGGAESGGASGPDDPFRSGIVGNGRVGADIKAGIGSSLTLEAAVNPDFGQVEADPAEVNLSAFETFFEEQRPFFVEGANLLTGSVNNYFYSRRIGAAPSGRASGDYVDAPRTTTILGSAKLTGRLNSGTSLGMLGAVTGEESARIFSNGITGRTRVAPRTTYGVARVGQDFGPPGSTAAIMATAVHRQLDPADPLSATLTKNALSLSGDSVIRVGVHDLRGFLGVSHVEGEQGALQRLQRSSARYYQRPDVDYVRFDPTRTTLTGAKGGFSVERRDSQHWLWEGSFQFETPGFETNDVGRVTSSDGITANGSVEYQQTTIGRWYRSYSIGAGESLEWNYGGEQQVGRVFTDFNVTWPNFWETEVNVAYDFRTQDMRLTRGGPSMEKPQAFETAIRFEGSESAQTRASVEATYRGTEDDGHWLTLETEISARPAPQWQISVAPTYQRVVDTQQYITTLPGGGAETFGSRYLFGRVDRTTYSAQLRLNYTFKPDLNLDFYGEPFVAKGVYDHFGQLAAARSRLLLPVSEDILDLDEPLDFDVPSFRSNLVLRWEWRAGSTLYLVWQQDRQEDRALNIFAVKASLWLSP